MLGLAVAAASGTTYAALLRQRIAEPLGLGATYRPGSQDELRDGALTGTDRRGRPVEPWTGVGLGPAGGVRSSAADLGRLLAALLDGSVAGVAALDGVRTFARGARIGAGWISVGVKGHVVTRHNGGTGGFRGWVGVDRCCGTGLAVVTATNRSVDAAGFTLLGQLRTG